MSAFLAALLKHYPDLVKRIQAVDEMVGNRQVDALEVLTRFDGHADKVTEVLKACVDDCVGFIEEYQADPQRLGFALMLASLRPFQLGLWLAESGLASMTTESVRRRLRAIDQATARAGRLEGDAPSA